MPPSKTLETGIQPDTWLTSILGYDVYKVAQLPASGLIAEGRALFYTRVPARDISQVSAFIQAGFLVVDMTLTFERRPASTATPAAGAIGIHRTAPGDTEAILRIAETAFEYSRLR